MEFISVFDVFKIGVGPSSSHTLGPWKAAAGFMWQVKNKKLHHHVTHLTVSLYGSLSLTGKGHATDLAVMMGLAGYDPETVDTKAIPDIISDITSARRLTIDGADIPFYPDFDIHFEKDFLPFHANGMIFRIENNNNEVYSETYYSVGGGFIVKEGESMDSYENAPPHPFPVENSKQLLGYCDKHNKNISEVVIENELVDRSKPEIDTKLLAIWEVMLESMYHGCHTKGTLPGILKVKRRATDVTENLLFDKNYHHPKQWIESIRASQPNFQDVLKWVGSFAIAVNEVNASFGRVVTAPTNGSAGVIPAVLMYYLCFVNKQAGDQEIIRFLCTAGEIGSIFKKGSTITF